MSEQRQARSGRQVCRDSVAWRERAAQSSHSSARDFDIGDSVGCLRYYAGWADKITGQVRPFLRISLSLFETTGGVLSPNTGGACPRRCSCRGQMSHRSVAASILDLPLPIPDHRNRQQDQVCVHEARSYWCLRSDVRPRSSIFFLSVSDIACALGGIWPVLLRLVLTHLGASTAFHGTTPFKCGA